MTALHSLAHFLLSHCLAVCRIVVTMVTCIKRLQNLHERYVTGSKLGWLYLAQKHLCMVFASLPTKMAHARILAAAGGALDFI